MILAAQAAQLLPLVGRQVAGLAPARIRVRLAQPVAQRLGRDPQVGSQRREGLLATPGEAHRLGPELRWVRVGECAASGHLLGYNDPILRCPWSWGNSITYVPRVVITDKLASYGAAMRDILPSVEHRRHKGLNNRAENSHQPTRERERRMRRFKDPGHAQRFLAAYGPIASHFRPRRHRLTAAAYRETRTERFATWRAVTGTPALA